MANYKYNYNKEKKKGNYALILRIYSRALGKTWDVVVICDRARELLSVFLVIPEDHCLPRQETSGGGG